MIEINYPAPSFNIKKIEELPFIYDPLRKKWLQLTPEEWVRQNFINYLIKVQDIPSAFIAQEKELCIGERRKRFDILIYNQQHTPWMMVECKAKEVDLSQRVLQQVLNYNMSVPVSYLIITNGNHCYGWKREDNQLITLQQIPHFE